MGRNKNIQKVIEDFFALVDQYLDTTSNQNEEGAYLVLYWLEKIAGEFKESESAQAKNFQDYWLDRKAKIKKLALTSDFQKVVSCLEKKLDQILDPEEWGVISTARELGEIRPVIKRATTSLTPLSLESED